MNSFKEKKMFRNNKKNILSNAISNILLGTTLSVSTFSVLASEEASEANIEVIAISGKYSKSLEKAIDIKRLNVGFSDSIVATDIADFPEQNLAEALQRMPGVTIEREKGLGTKVNVRGLPSEFTHVSINGVATASGSGGRDVEFDIFASEIIQSVSVQKSPTAANEEGGIAGSVLITTARPFDYIEDKFIASAEVAHNSISEEIDPKFSVLASKRFGDWGALFSFASAKRVNRTDANSGVEFRPLSRWLEKNGSDSKQAQSDQAAEVLFRDTGITIDDRFDKNETERVVFINKVGERVYINEQEKWGGTASFQYKPSNTFNLTFDAMLGGYDQVEDEYDAAAYSASSNSTLDTIHSFDSSTLAADGITVLTDVTYTSTQHELLSKEHVTETDYSQFSLDMDWEVNGWEVNGLLGYSGAERLADFTNLKYTNYAESRSRFTSNGGENIVSNEGGFDMFALDTIDQYNFVFYEVELEETSDDKYAAQLDFKKTLGIELLPALSSVQFGVRYTDKKKTRDIGKVKVKGPGEGNSSWAIGDNIRTIDPSEVTQIADLVPGGSYVPTDLDWYTVSNTYARDEFRYDGFNVPYEPDQSYQVEEDTFAFYAMTNFDFEIGYMPVFINTGVRAIQTDILSSGFREVRNADGFTSELASKKGSYRNVLPSFNMTVEITDDLVFRAAASETLMRPSLSDIAYRRAVNTSSVKYTDGNPDLDPTYAKQWEIGLEWYLEEGGLLAASFFSKDIEGVVEERRVGEELDVTKFNDDGSIDGVFDFDIYSLVNAPGSYTVEGIELIVQIPLKMLYESLEGFGINTNFTFLDSSLTGSSDLDIATQPVGLADETYNATLYYEKDKFDARISYNYKSEYVEGIERNNYPIYRDAYGQYDISIGYQLTDDIKVSLKGINISDEETASYNMNEAFPSKYELSGRRLSLGVRASF
jgi:TonB-dependent receptor